MNEFKVGNRTTRPKQIKFNVYLSFLQFWFLVSIDLTKTTEARVRTNIGLYAHKHRKHKEIQTSRTIKAPKTHIFVGSLNINPHHGFMTSALCVSHSRLIVDTKRDGLFKRREKVAGKS